MNWRHIRLIAGREMRDQLRDRRMIFLIVVLPVLMYPLMGMSMFQIQQFQRREATSVAVVGAEHLPAEPPLLEGDYFAAELFRELDGWEPSRDAAEQKDPEQAAQRRKQRLLCKRVDRPVADPKELLSTYDLVLVIPPNFAAQLAAFQQALRDRQGKPSETAVAWPTVPAPLIYYDSAKERSQAACNRIWDVLNRWSREAVRAGIGLVGTPQRPFRVYERDQAGPGYQQIAAWSQIFPFLLILWALTGAFQPAVDLCAGEKERGTLETLLASPASRRDIVCGKLLAIMGFSAASVLINVVSLAGTAHLILSKIQALGAPPLIALIWLLVALPPLTALFSALCLGLSAFARSAKEGNYYMMPLFLFVLPLVLSVMGPSAQMTAGKSLIPVAGMALLLRVLIEGDYATALPHILPVFGVTIACAVFATQWTIGLFSQESVLFREAERFDAMMWAKAIYRDRGPLPSPGAALGCAMTILTLRFMSNFVISVPSEFDGFALVNTGMMAATILLPAVVMTLLFARDFSATLKLRAPQWQHLPAVVLLAVVWQPLQPELLRVVTWLFPLDTSAAKQISDLFEGAPAWKLVLCFALVPAVCEELAFRGFILSGLEKNGRVTAIVVSSFFFGVTHLLLQQSMMAALVGAVLAYIALATRSIWPGMLYHLCHNGLNFTLPGWLAQQSKANPESVGWLLRAGEAGSDLPGYQWPIVAGAAAVGAAILWMFWQDDRQNGAQTEQSLSGAPPENLPS